MMHLTSVLLPAPFSPRSACTDPRASFSDTFSSARTDPNCLEIPSASSAGVAASTTARAPSPISRLMTAPPSSAREVDTVPNTPFCIFTILIAAAWLPASVAAQQSSRIRHS